MYKTSRKAVMARLSLNDAGGIEGLPLILIILIVVAAVGLGILLIWANSADDEPDTIATLYVKRAINNHDIPSTTAIKLEPAELDAEASINTINLHVFVGDQNQDPVGGATVTLSGCGVSEVDDTYVSVHGGNRGWASFNGITPKPVLAPGVATGVLTVTAAKPGYTPLSIEIPVTRILPGQSAGHYGPGDEYLGI